MCLKYTLCIFDMCMFLCILNAALCTIKVTTTYSPNHSKLGIHTIYDIYIFGNELDCAHFPDRLKQYAGRHDFPQTYDTIQHTVILSCVVAVCINFKLHAHIYWVLLVSIHYAVFPIEFTNSEWIPDCQLDFLTAISNATTISHILLHSP